MIAYVVSYNGIQILWGRAYPEDLLGRAGGAKPQGAYSFLL
jgi:hypothetical protein